MCGINGIYGLRDTGRAQTIIQKMNNSLQHRGPDDEGYLCDGKITLGHRRLSIIDLSEAGHQPMQSYNSRYTIIFNGEIYNYRGLRKEIGDYPYKSETDTEVLLAAYEKWGKGCLEKLNGMFAFAIWDKQQQELFLARDRLGIKPLYYYRDDECFLFSSEIRPLLNSGLVPRKINRAGLWDYFRYQTVHAPETMIDKVFMLLPGHWMSVSENRVETGCYWKLDQAVSAARIPGDYGVIKREINQLLLKAVERRLVADVPFGAFLSGGIDSSIVVGLMSRLIPGKVKTFSVTFDEHVFSEAPYSQMVADRFETDHTEIRLTPDQFLDLLPEAMNAMDHPSGDGPNTYVVSKVTREAGVTMALSGLGGDELFAGYDIFKRGVRLEKLNWLPRVVPGKIRSAVGELATAIQGSVAAEKLNTLMSLDRWNIKEIYPVSRQLLMDNRISELLSDELKCEANVVSQVLEKVLDSRTDIPGLSKISIAEISTYMQNVLLRDTDQMSMASALEVRVPFLDHELVEYVLQVPDPYKYPHSPKKLLTDSVDGLIPNDIIDRKKMGFELPWKVWLKNELRSESEETMKNLAERPFMNAGRLLKHWNNFLQDDPGVSWSRVWTLIVLEDWLKKNEVEY